jgi:hypothetical protein
MHYYKPEHDEPSHPGYLPDHRTESKPSGNANCRAHHETGQETGQEPDDAESGWRTEARRRVTVTSDTCYKS